MKKNSFSPDRVCEKYLKKKIKIRIYIKRDIIFVEGTKDSLEFLSRLFLAQANFKTDCGFQISPFGAGRFFFHPRTEKGLYIHRIPCLERTRRKKRRK